MGFNTPSRRRRVPALTRLYGAYSAEISFENESGRPSVRSRFITAVANEDVPKGGGNSLGKYPRLRRSYRSTIGAPTILSLFRAKPGKGFDLRFVSLLLP